MGNRKQRVSRGTRGRFRRLARCCLALLGVVIILLLVGCPGPPWYEVVSYEQLKQELADKTGIIYPEIDKYEQSGIFTYAIYVTPDQKREQTGYMVNSRGKELKDATIDTAFSGLEISCGGIEYISEEWPPLVETLIYRSIGMEYSIGDSTESLDTEQLDALYPKAAKFGGISYSFFFNGYRYILNAQVVFTHDDLKTTTFEVELDKARSELFVIIDSILDQGGIMP